MHALLAGCWESERFYATGGLRCHASAKFWVVKTELSLFEDWCQSLFLSSKSDVNLSLSLLEDGHTFSPATPFGHEVVALQSV